MPVLCFTCSQRTRAQCPSAFRSETRLTVVTRLKDVLKYPTFGTLYLLSMKISSDNYGTRVALLLSSNSFPVSVRQLRYHFVFRVFVPMTHSFPLVQQQYHTSKLSEARFVVSCDNHCCSRSSIYLFIVNLTFRLRFGRAEQVSRAENRAGWSLLGSSS